MATTTWEGGDRRRPARLRDALRLPIVRRLLIIAGFAVAAWLAGVATAHASGGTADLSSPLAPVHRVTAQVESTVHSPHPVARDDRDAGPVLGPGHPDRRLHETAHEFVGRVHAVTQPVTGTLHRIAQPVAAATRPIDAVISPARTPAAVHDVRRHRFAVTAASAAHRVTSDSAAARPTADAGDAHRYRTSVAPHQPVPPVSGLIGTNGGTATGCCPGGFPTLSHASGPAWSERATGGAGASRVTPRTAVAGQLPDHVEDPAVSPD